VPDCFSETKHLGDSRRFAYDANGQLVEQVDRNERMRRFEYDSVGNLAQEQWLDGALIVRAISFTYDPVVVGGIGHLAVSDFPATQCGQIELVFVIRKYGIEGVEMTEIGEQPSRVQ
jgi:YD repeat-containing protein